MADWSIITTAMGASWVSGINLYATVLTLGLLGRYAGVTLPGELAALTSWWVLGTAGVLYLIEFVADKIPYIDNLWDAVHTFIRVPAGAVLAAAAFARFDPAITAIATLIGGGLALSAHGTKATTRAIINTSPEPVTNVAASVGEDVVAVGGASLAVFSPVVMSIVVVSGVILSLVLIPRIFRYFFTLRGRLIAGFAKFFTLEK